MKILKGHFVYDINHNKNGNIEEKIDGYNKQITLNQENNIVNISLQDYLGNPLPYEPVNISITGKDAEDIDLEPFEDICDDGTIELDNYEIGDALTITATADYMESAILEVVIE